jgi:hypothetical protein
MSSLNCKNSVTPAIGFVDIATLSELEAYLYGGQQSITYFVRSVLKSNWFSFVATALRHVSGCADFGNDFSASVNRSGDYVLNTWFRCQVPEIACKNFTNSSGVYFRWTHNFGHNLIKYCNITFNELKVHEFDSTWLDNWAAYNVTASKRVGYENMIGNVSAMTMFKPVVGVAQNAPKVENIVGTGGFINIPLPFFYTVDSGVALPVAAIPFNDIKINYCFRDWKDMIVVGQKYSAALSPNVIYPASDSVRTDVLNNIYTVNTTWTAGVATYTWGNQGVKLQHCETLAHYVVVHNDERVLMGKCPRDIAIHQIQFLQDQQFDLEKSQQCFDLRFSHSVSMIFYSAKNLSWAGEHSQYSVWDFGVVDNPTSPDITGLNGFDPIEKTQLIYENTARFDGGSDYGSLIVPFYFGKVIPDVSGYHVLSYTLEMFSLDPKGSTGYSKLANVSIIHHRSQAAYNASVIGGVIPSTQVQFPSQKHYKNKVLCDNWNIIRLSGGSLGLPIL